jgi:hypothetical protein
MLRLLTIALFMFQPALAYDSTTTYDSSSGNVYTTQSYGGTTTTQGYNSQTGSTWSQTTAGGVTTGVDSSGNTWSSYGTGN